MGMVILRAFVGFHPSANLAVAKSGELSPGTNSSRQYPVIQNTLLLAVVGGAFALVAYHSTFRFRGPLKYIALMPLYRE